MKLVKSLQFGWMTGSLALACVFMSIPTTTHAYVYATDIKIGGTLTNGQVPIAQSGTATITYILNETASNGVTIAISDTNANIIYTNTIASPAAGTLRGLNSFVWGTTNNDGSTTPVGNYSVSITAATRGYTIWTQTSVDASAGTPAHFPLGIDVNKNTNSPYYGRVVFGCALHTGTVNATAAGQKTGIFKANADGSQADEGWYGNAGYLADDGGDGAVAGQMPDSGGFDPMKIRIGDDDRIYWVDNSSKGAILATDMQATTNQVVASDGGVDVGPSMTGMADWSDAAAGIQEFDITQVTTTNGALWVCDNDFPNFGVWMFHMTNTGTIDPNDTQGTQAVFAGSGSDLSLVSSGGCMIDNNLDIWAGQDRNNANAVYFAMEFSNWNMGTLPPENSGFNFSLLTSAWGYGCSVGTTCTTAAANTFEGLRDVVINSRSNPTILACPTTAGSQDTAGSGIRLLNATNGSVITVTNSSGTVIQNLTNLDFAQQYAAAAWDNVGNLYGASTSRNLWRAWSPPGGSTNTTVAVETISIQPLPATASLAATTFSGAASSNAAAITATYNGTAPVTIQWFYIDLSNTTNPVIGQVTSTSTTSTLTLTNLQDSQNGYQYFLNASNTLGGTNSTTATLTVVNPIATLAATTFGGEANGSSTNITATFNGNSQTVQWYQVDTGNNTTAVPSGEFTVAATSTTLTLTNLSASQNGDKYYATVSWPYAPTVNTAMATLTVYNSPSISTDITPLTEYVPIGYTDSNFKVAANGAIPLSYQWYNDGVAINGATNTSLSFTATNGTHTYYVNVANSVNPTGVNSSTATVISPSTALSFSSTLGVNSGTGWQLNGTSPSPTFISPGVLQLTAAATSKASSAFYSLGKLSVNGFVASFTFTPSGGTATRADGITFCVQNKATTAVGASGGSLGVTTITPSVELELNIYTGAAGGVGISFDSNGTVGPTNGPTGSVNLNSLDPIGVTVVYNPTITNVMVILLDKTTGATYTTNYSQSIAAANITNILGATTAWVGFTGATGGSDAVMQVSNFLYQNISNAVLSAGSLTSGTLPFTWNVAGFTLQSGPTVQGPWSNVGGPVVTNMVTGQASMTVTPSSPNDFFRLVTP